MAQKQWLPAKLLTTAVRRARKRKRWSLGGNAVAPRLVLTEADGYTFLGSFTLSGDLVRNVRVAVSKTRPTTVPTRPAGSAPSGESR